MEVLAALASHLATARQQSGLSLTEAADKAEVDPGDLYSYEQGKGDPAFNEIRSLAMAYNVTMDYLSSLTTDPVHQEVAGA